MKVSERWLREYITVDAPVEDIARTLTMAGLEVKNVGSHATLPDTVFEIEITSNRPDWLNYVGIARELSALYNVPVHQPRIDEPAARSAKERFTIACVDRVGCPYYAGVIIRGIKNIPSPTEIQEKLIAVGLRPVNLIVDITNIVLLELGQPMHAFDLRLLQGGCIRVQRAARDEKFTAINHTEYILRDTDLVITDGKRTIALAGIIGGEATEVSDQTADILLESAYFDPATIRATARHHVLSTDASYRFERKVDIGMVRKAQNRFITLLKKYTTFDSVSAVFQDGDDTASPWRIDFPLEMIQKCLGFPIDRDTIVALVKNLGLTVGDTKGAGTVLPLQVPTFRSDLTRPIDIVEEIARIYGYDKVPETFPQRIVQRDELDEYTDRILSRIHQACTAGSFYEIVPFTLIDEKKIMPFVEDPDTLVRIVNPQHKDLCVLRPTMLPGMLEVIAHNISHDETDIRLYETGHVYKQAGEDQLPHESKKIGMAVCGKSPQQWTQQGRAYDLFDLKGAIENIADAAGIVITATPEPQWLLDEHTSFTLRCGDTPVGYFGKVAYETLRAYAVADDVFFAELDIAQIVRCAKLDVRYQEPSKYPAVKRDIAVIVDRMTPVGDIRAAIETAGGDLVSKIDLFDIFSGGQIERGKKSVAFSLEFCSYERTLSGDEVQQLYDEICRVLHAQLGARLRDV